MKYRRILCILLVLLFCTNLLALPTQAVTNPAFQWLVDFTKSNGNYDATNKTYGVAWYADRFNQTRVALLQYNETDGSLYLAFESIQDIITYLVLTPDLSTPYQAFIQAYQFAAQYSIYPGSYNGEQLHYDQFYGDPGYQNHPDSLFNSDFCTLLGAINNLFLLFGTGYQVCDLGFTSFTQHYLHLYGDPEPVGAVVCGAQNHYRVHCVVCGYERDYYEYMPHVKGDVVWEQEPTCTEGGYGYYHCSRCGASMENVTNPVEAPPLGHDWALQELETPITGTEHVQGVIRCNRCNEEIVGEYCAEFFFTDMPPRESWSHIPIDWAFAGGITAGTSATTFSPDATCTRGQIVTFLWRAKGSPEPATNVSPFNDVQDPSQYYYKAVLWAVENGITAGTSATTFSPNDGCTRAQVVTFLWRAEGKPAPESTINPFADVSDGQYYTDAVLWAVDKGVTSGTGATTFSPDTTCTRSQIVTFLYRDLAE